VDDIINSVTPPEDKLMSKQCTKNASGYSLRMIKQTQKEGTQHYKETVPNCEQWSVVQQQQMMN
jgi:hypothetical protein